MMGILSDRGAPHSCLHGPRPHQTPLRRPPTASARTPPFASSLPSPGRRKPALRPRTTPLRFPRHQGEQPVVAVAPLAAHVGQVEAVATGEVSTPRWAVELANPATALLTVEHTGAGEPPAHPAKGG